MKLQFIIVLFFRIVVGYDSLINIFFYMSRVFPPSLPPSLSPINNCNMTINLLKKINSCNKNTTCFLFVYKNQFDSCSSLHLCTYFIKCKKICIGKYYSVPNELSTCYGNCFYTTCTSTTTTTTTTTTTKKDITTTESHQTSTFEIILVLLIILVLCVFIIKNIFFLNNYHSSSKIHVAQQFSKI